MPADLPPQSAYTYAVSLSVDEARDAGATSVEFNQPVVSYVENFLGFPVGTGVPAGYYDAAKGQWVAVPNGRVIKVLGTSQGLADLDADGDGSPDSAEALQALGIGPAERSQLAGLYPAGQALWRVLLTHFSDWDYNSPPSCDGCTPPNSGPPNRDPPKNCKATGSIILCQAQTLGESVRVHGTPYSLEYWSDRAQRDSHSMRVMVSGPDPVPATLKRIEASVGIAGQLIEKSFVPGPNQDFMCFNGTARTLLGARWRALNPCPCELPMSTRSSTEAPPNSATSATPSLT
jgi:hypothetical protein